MSKKLIVEFKILKTQKSITQISFSRVVEGNERLDNLIQLWSEVQV